MKIEGRMKREKKVFSPFFPKKSADPGAATIFPSIPPCFHLTIVDSLIEVRTRMPTISFYFKNIFFFFLKIYIFWKVKILPLLVTRSEFDYSNLWEYKLYNRDFLFLHIILLQIFYQILRNWLRKLKLLPFNTEK